MNRQQKELFVQELVNGFDQSEGIFLVGYKGLKVSQATNLRKKLHDVGGSFQVAKVTLIKRAIHDNDAMSEKFMPFLKDQIALVFSREGSSGVAKVLHDFSKKNKRLDVIAGCVDKTFLNAQDFVEFVSLPSREILLAHLLSTMNAPLTQFVVLLKMLLTRFVVVLDQVEKQKTKMS